MDCPQRKQVRLPCYDYSTGGVYFVTICAQNRKNLFADYVTVRADDTVRPCAASPEGGAEASCVSVGADDSVRPHADLPTYPLRLTEAGRIVEYVIDHTPEHIPGVSIETYVIMPNHVHILIGLHNGRTESSAPTRVSLPQVVQRIKSLAARKCWPLGHKTLWQRSFHEHVVRNEADYLRIWEYIENNPYRWCDDIYFSE